MTTLISSVLLSRAAIKFSGFSLRVMSFASQAGSALARVSPALYHWRLFAFTLPTITLFLYTVAAATSANTPAPITPPYLFHNLGNNFSRFKKNTQNTKCWINFNSVFRLYSSSL